MAGHRASVTAGIESFKQRKGGEFLRSDPLVEPLNLETFETLNFETFSGGVSSLRRDN